jgi:hypothetical protein
MTGSVGIKNPLDIKLRNSGEISGSVSFKKEISGKSEVKIQESGNTWRNSHSFSVYSSFMFHMDKTSG